MYEELKQKIMKWTPFLNRNKTLMCREQVLCLINEAEWMDFADEVEKELGERDENNKRI